MTRLPPVWAILACLLLFGFGELAGAVLGGFAEPVQEFTRGIALARPEVHGLVGVADIDRAILEGVESEVLARIHTFHLHAHGLALVVFVLCLILNNLALSGRVRTVLMVLTCVGLLYPFGWLAVALAVPFSGKAAAFSLAERLFFVPFGGGFLAMVWAVIGVFLIKAVWRGGGQQPGSD